VLQEYASRQCIAFMMTMVSIFCLIVATSTSWYFIWSKGVEISQGKRGDTVTYFVWTGLEVHNSPYDAPSSTHDLRWKDLPSSRPKEVYINSQAMVLVALGLSLLLMLLILFGLMVDRTAKLFQKVFKNQTKAVAVMLGGLVILFTILAWTLYLRFPSALNDADYCVPPFISGGKGRYWCEDFAGIKKNVGPYNSSYTWYPALGWLFAILGMAFACGSSFLTLIVKAKPELEYTATDLGDYREIS